MPKNNRKNTNILSNNARIDSQRREAMKDLRDLSLLGVGSILGLQTYKDSKAHSIESHIANTLDSAPIMESHSLETLQSHSNIPSQILSLPLKYFNVPQEYTMLLESKLPRNQREHLTCIVPLLTSKDFDHTMPSLYHRYNVENINTHRIYNETSTFLQYHYDTLGSLLKDLQSHNFIARDYRALSQDKNLTESFMQEIMQNLIIDTTSHISLDDIRRYQVPKDSSLYRKFKAGEKEDDVSAIDAYNEALEILAEYREYYFTNARNGKRDTNKARRLVECLNIIGQNNIRALYVGTSEDSRNMKRPKFIGRLATTIIIEDGLWLG